MAEFIADIFLCPYEACRIRLVSQPDYADSLMGVAKRMSSEMGFVGAFYSGFVPILFKQVHAVHARHDPPAAMRHAHATRHPPPSTNQPGPWAPF